jgi:hypothetical protein
MPISHARRADPAPALRRPLGSPAGLDTAAPRHVSRLARARRGAPGRHRQPLGPPRGAWSGPWFDDTAASPRPWSQLVLELESSKGQKVCAHHTSTTRHTRVRPPRPEISRSDRGLPDGQHAPRSACDPTVSVSHRGTHPPCDWKRNSAPPIETQTQFAAAKISDSWTRRSLPLTCIGCICIGCTWRCLAVYPRRLSDPLSCCHPTFSSCHGRHQTGT